MMKIHDISVDVLRHSLAAHERSSSLSRQFTMQRSMSRGESGQSKLPMGCLQVQVVAYIVAMAWLLWHCAHSKYFPNSGTFQSAVKFSRAIHRAEHEEVAAYASIGPIDNFESVRGLCHNSRPAATGHDRNRKMAQLALPEDGPSFTKLPNVSFRTDVVMANLCSVVFQPRDLRRLRRALADDFQFITIVDEVPANASAGKINLLEDSMEEYFLFTHLALEVLYTRKFNVVLKVGVVAELPLDITEKLTDAYSDGDGGIWSDLPLEVQFTFSVKWTSADDPDAVEASKHVQNLSTQHPQASATQSSNERQDPRKFLRSAAGDQASLAVEERNNLQM